MGKPEAAMHDGMAESRSVTGRAGVGPGQKENIDPDGMRAFMEVWHHIFTLPQLPLVVAPAKGP